MGNEDGEVSSSKGERFEMGGGSGLGSGSGMPSPDDDPDPETETETAETTTETTPSVTTDQRVVTDKTLFDSTLPLLHTRKAKSKGIGFNRPDRLTIDVQDVTDTLVEAVCREADDHFAEYDVQKGDAYEAIVLNGILKSLGDGVDTPITHADLDIGGVVAVLEQFGYGYDD